MLSFVMCLFVSCSASGEDKSSKNLEAKAETKVYSKFTGNYNKTFDDLHDLHIAAALENGIEPMDTKDDTAKMLNKLVFMPQELYYYKMDKLTHSVPYLVPKASDLLMQICENFSDSLVSKGLPRYKLILTSLTRTNLDVTNLTRRNGNASDNSAHCYGTTFDISWRRFEKINPHEQKELGIDRLKRILGEVLNDLRERDRCYIKHERRQACFHITVR